VQAVAPARLGGLRPGAVEPLRELRPAGQEVLAARGPAAMAAAVEALEAQRRPLRPCRHRLR
jgi:hypothetical protein